MKRYMWIAIENTRVLFRVTNDIGLVGEWHPIAQVTLRQIYERQAPQWYVWWFDLDAIVGSNTFETVAEAMDFAERRYGCTGEAKPGCSKVKV